MHSKTSCNKTVHITKFYPGYEVIPTMDYSRFSSLGQIMEVEKVVDVVYAKTGKSYRLEAMRGRFSSNPADEALNSLLLIECKERRVSSHGSYAQQ